MGITTHLDGIPAETLGGLRLGVSPLEMADAYSTLASGGMPQRADRDPQGRLPGRARRRHRRSAAQPGLPDGVASTVTDILQDNVDAGTGTAAQTDCTYEAGKTGTT